MNKLDTVIPLDLNAWPIKHPSIPVDTSSAFYGPDSEKVFQRNLRERSDDWIFRTEPVHYNFNKQGLRMKKDLSEVDPNYIMFCGASFTGGVGVGEHRRFSDIVSSSMGLDYINYYGPLYSAKAMVHSFFNFLNTNYHLPKILVAEYAPAEGQMFYSNNNFLLYSSDKAADIDKFPHHYAAYKELEKTDFLVQESRMWRNSLVSACKRLGIKLIEVSFWHNDPFTIVEGIESIDATKHKDNINYCFGRDFLLNNAHPGIGVHKEMSDVILKRL